MPDVNYRSVFKDIVYGFSAVKFSGEELYLKHLSVLDQVDFEEVQKRFFEEARGRGIPTNEEILDRLKEEGTWTKQDDGKILSKEQYLNNLYDTKKGLYLKSEIDRVNGDIIGAEKELNLLRGDKYILMGPTCEKWAESRVTDHYIFSSFFTDKELKTPKFSSDTIGDLRSEELKPIIEMYSESNNLFTDLHVQKLILEDFYSMYFPFSDNVSNFFDKPLFQLSNNQVRMVVFTKMFKNVFENNPKMPEAIKKDPDKIFDYVNAQGKAEKVAETLDKDGASTIFGATDEDYAYLGYDKQKGESLSKMLKDNGGKMDMKQLMEKMG